MSRTIRIGSAVAALASSTAPALAHPGGHSHLTFETLISHLSQAGHLAFIVLLIVLAVLGVALRGRWTRQAEKPRKR